MLRQQRPVAAVVALVEEGRLPAVAALGDMMRQAGGDDAGETRHDRPLISLLHPASIA
jgi:hypothetical protein